MMEENVVSQAGAPTAQKWSMSPEELELHIRQAGFAPVQRDSNFKVIAPRETYPTTNNGASALEAPPA
jgi:2-iminoacetate synthase ThiH